MRDWTQFIVLICTLVVCTGCPPDKAQIAVTPPTRDDQSARTDPVAVVNGEVITYGEFERRINGLHPYARSRFVNLEARTEFLDRQIEFELLAQHAEKSGYLSSPEVRHVMKETMVRQLLEKELAKRVTSKDVSPENIQEAYQDHIEHYRKPEVRRAAVVQSESEEAAKALHAKMSAAPLSVEDFAAFAQENKSADLKQNGGVIGWLEDPAAPKAKNTGRNKAIALKVFELENSGDLTAPFLADGSWYVATYVSRRPAQETPFEEVSSAIRDRLYKEKREAARMAYIEELKRSSKVELFPAKLADIEMPPAESQKKNVLKDFRPSFKDIRGRSGAAADERAGEEGKK